MKISPKIGVAPVVRLLTPATRYTRFVIFGRSFLWLLVAVMVGIVVWIASNDKGADGSRLVFSAIKPEVVKEVVQNAMLKPHYQGMDADNHPFTVIADKAVQKDKETVVLDNIRADMMQAGGKWLALNSGSGELNLQSRHLKLNDGVSMFYDGGYEFRSDHAQVDIAKGEAYGDSPVEGQGPSGTLNADSFKVSERGQVIRFNGSVRMKLYP